DLTLGGGALVPDPGDEGREAFLGGRSRGVLVPGEAAARRRGRGDHDRESPGAGRDPAGDFGGEGLARQGLVGDDEDRAHRDRSVWRTALGRIVGPTSMATPVHGRRFRHPDPSPMVPPRMGRLTESGSEGMIHEVTRRGIHRSSTHWLPRMPRDRNSQPAPAPDTEPSDERIETRYGRRAALSAESARGS